MHFKSICAAWGRRAEFKFQYCTSFPVHRQSFFELFEYACRHHGTRRRYIGTNFMHCKFWIAIEMTATVPFMFCTGFGITSKRLITIIIPIIRKNWNVAHTFRACIVVCVVQINRLMSLLLFVTSILCVGPELNSNRCICTASLISIFNKERSTGGKKKTGNPLVRRCRNKQNPSRTPSAMVNVRYVCIRKQIRSHCGGFEWSFIPCLLLMSSLDWSRSTLFVLNVCNAIYMKNGANQERWKIISRVFFSLIFAQQNITKLTVGFHSPHLVYWANTVHGRFVAHRCSPFCCIPRICMAARFPIQRSIGPLCIHASHDKSILRLHVFE